MVTPKVYKKAKLTDNGDIIEEEFTLWARKLPLYQVCDNEVHRLEAEGVLRIRMDDEYDSMTPEDTAEHLKAIGEFDPTEDIISAKKKLKQYERTIHLAYWHDTSSVANHGHVLMTVNPLYDPASFLRPDEMLDSSFKDVHTTAETPQLYLLTRSSSSDAEQLSYIETRLEDTTELKVYRVKTSKGIPLKFVMLFFDGDGPAHHFETRERNGGHDGCSGCVGDARRFCDLAHTYRAEHLTLDKRKEIVSAGPAGKRNGGIQKWRNSAIREIEKG